jgi:hypothetical protein
LEARKEMRKAADESSKGSIGFFRDPNGVRHEMFERDGGVYRAPVSSVVMPDGFRSGRWVCDSVRWAGYASACGFVFES